ncbi:Fic family protein [Candidatus Gottesmanbacteria bacterium]|nr:Fic family protein [Candidatus Gottesmanbacteria bacterium]
MKLDYYYRRTKVIAKAMEELKVMARVIALLPSSPHLEENLRRESLLKSSLFSARIEGNKLRLEDLSFISLQRNAKNIAKIEVANVLKGLTWVYSKAPKKLSYSTILKLHGYVLANLSPEAGEWRREPSAIFSQAQVAVYLTPPASKIPSLIKTLVAKINSSEDEGPVNAATYHFAFEKIHPFLDGNGRTGRLLATLILKNSGFGFRGLVSLEEYLESKRQTYYDLLALNKKDVTEFVEFFLEGLQFQTDKTMEKLKNAKTETVEDWLLPRRREILEIVRNHQIVSFDFLKRRFQKIPKSTLHYDVSQLLKEGFLIKLGTSRGALYRPTFYGRQT